MDQSHWTEQAQLMLHNMSDTIVRYSYSFGYWALLLQRHIAGLKTVVCTGKEANKYRREMLANYAPEAFLLTSQKEISEMPVLEKKFFADKLYIFVCTEKACLSPVSSPDEAFSLIKL
jgi:uncharacterized protein YyaL (SSP411 family)